MSVRGRTLVFAVAAAVALQAGSNGIKPRPSRSDYQARTTTSEGASIAASLLGADEVKNEFATDLNRGWIVVEVAVYPPDNRQTTVEKSDFWLQIGSGGQRTAVRATDARTIAGVLNRANQAPAGSSSDVTVYPSVGIGYESGPVGYDPATGTRRGGGWRTSTGVGVGIGKQGDGMPPAASTGRDRETMELELSEKSFPAGATTQPVAGYLYFPLPPKKIKNATYDLEYHGSSGVRRLAFPRPNGR